MIILNVSCVFWFKVDGSKMSSEHEISDIKGTLELLEEEKKNLTKHFELQIQDKLSAL